MLVRLGWYAAEAILRVPEQKNACRALHSLVNNAGVLLQLEIDAVQIVVRRVKPVGHYTAWWPTLTMQSWAKYLLQYNSKVILGGFDIQNSLAWRKQFYDFWALYKSVDPQHPIYTSSCDWSYVIPYAFHGDEGRGKGRHPFLVLSWQPLISYKGIGTCNDSSYLA